MAFIGIGLLALLALRRRKL
ncbi:MAG: hypothetical protein ABR955_12555 [Verrucomicrobiota bacterium]